LKSLNLGAQATVFVKGVCTIDLTMAQRECPTLSVINQCTVMYEFVDRKNIVALLNNIAGVKKFFKTHEKSSVFAKNAEMTFGSL
jgi:hypothetical protein